MNPRSEFNDFGDIVYLDAATKGPLPLSTQAAIREASKLQSEPWRLQDHMWFDVPDRTRTLCAEMIGAEPTEIAICTSTSYGMNTLAQGIQWNPGDTILLIQGNFASNVYPWMNLQSQGVEVKFVKWTAPGELVPQEQLEELIIPGVRLVSIDYPHWTNGYLMDLHSLKTKCNDVGAWLVLDCTQSIGVVPIDVTKTPVDALVASGYKFMLCPYGTAFMYLSKKLQDAVSVTMPTWQGMVNARDFSKLNEYNFSYVQNAARYDVGEHTSFLNIMGMNASLEFLLEVGVEKIYRHILSLLDQLVSELDTLSYRLVSDISANRRSAMMRFVPKDEKQIQPIVKRLRDNQVYVSYRDNGIRVTPHIYNNEDDINRLIELL